MKKWIRTAVICSIFIMLSGCSRNEKMEGTAYQVYYVNNTETSIFSNEYRTNSTDTEAVLAELLEQLKAMPEKLEYKPPLGGNFELLDYTLSEGQLTLNFDGHYMEQEVTTEILVRAAIVRTVTQIKGIDYVSVTVNGAPLTDNTGNIVGIMSADMFIDNAGNEINTYEKVKLRLYLANETGDALKQVNRTVVYNSNISMEKLVIEQLILGPKENEAAFAVMDPNTKIVSVSVKDGVCYVNLDATFLTPVNQVTAEVMIYSIANSLVELSNVNKVQISIDGATDVLLKETISLDTIFERNLDLVK